MNILFLNVGRRCEIVDSFKNALSIRGGGLVLGSDISPLAPGFQVVDKSVVFPGGDSANFKDFLITFCKDNEVELVIPTIDPDLLRLDRIRKDIKKALPWCRLLLPPAFTIEYSQNKNLSKELFLSLDVSVPRDLRVDSSIAYPVFVRPAYGSAGVGAQRVESEAELMSRLEQDSTLMIEELISGPEYTVDVLCDFEGRALIAVPRRRIKVRDGEVVQGVVELNAELEALAKKLAEGLKATGPITLQFRRCESTGRFVAIEANARMGGGLPLTIAAGADWPGWILDLRNGRNPKTDVPIEDRLVMTRCDKSYFIPNLSKNRKAARLSQKPADIFVEKLRSSRVWLFDMDDTLFPERDFVFSGYRAVAQKVFSDFNIEIESQLREMFLKGVRGDLFSLVLKNAGIEFDEAYVQELVKSYREHFPSIRPYVDVEPTLALLRDKECKIGLVSDGWSSVQRNKLSALKIEHLFEAVVFTDEIDGLKSWKPTSTGYSYCLELLGMKPEQGIVVGDNPRKDFSGAKELGLLTMKIRRPGAEHSLMSNSCEYSTPDFTIRSFAEFTRLL